MNRHRRPSQPVFQLLLRNQHLVPTIALNFLVSFGQNVSLTMLYKNTALVKKKIRAVLLDADRRVNVNKIIYPQAFRCK
jgi:hypothetical protein